MVSMRNRYSKIILLMTEFIESFVEKDPSLLQKQNDIFLDIDLVKEAEDLKEVEPATLVALGLVLLKQLQPYVQELSDVKHIQNLKSDQTHLDSEITQENTFDERVLLSGAQVSSNIENLEARNITLK